MTKAAAIFLYAEAAIPLFGAGYCWHNNLIFGGFAWLTIALALITVGTSLYRET